MEELKFPELLSIYADFSHNLWDRTSEKLGWKVKIVYEYLNLPLLHGDITLLYDSNNYKSVPCKYGTLPRKRLLKDRDQKIVGSSVLVRWIQEELEKLTGTSEERSE